MTMNADGSRTIRAVDDVSYAEASVQARIAEQQLTIEALRAETRALRLRLENAAEDARTRRYAEAVADLFSRWSDGLELPVSPEGQTEEQP